MIHITCDLCGKQLQTGEDHFVVKIETFAAQNPQPLTDEDLDEDHMESVGQMLAELEGQETPDCFEPKTREFRYDLCPECKTRYLADPLNRDREQQKLHFSEN